MAYPMPHNGLSDEDLADMRQFASAECDGPSCRKACDHTLRLLDENARLNTENERFLRIINEITRDNAGLTACLDAVQAEARKMLAEHGQSWNSISGRRILNVFDAAPEMPRPPAVEAPTHFTPYGHAATSCGETIPKRMPWNFAAADWDSPAITTRRAMATCVLCLAVFRNASESANGTTQERAGDTDTSGAGSGRGTGVAEAPGTARAGEAWIPSFAGDECPHRPEWTCPEHEECRSCECDCNTYVADLEEPDLTLIPGDMVVRDPGICSGRPTMRGTRILASRIAGELAAGTSWETLREWYPSLPVPGEEA